MKQYVLVGKNILVKRGKRLPKKGYKQPEWFKKMMGERRKGSNNGMYGTHRVGEKNPFYGKKHTLETTQKIKNTLKGKLALDKNPAWCGGRSFEPYCPKFNRKFKERVREYFNRTCQICGITEIELGYHLCVHHVTYNKETCCDDSTPRFIVLCSSCHTKTNFNRDYWREYLGSQFRLFTP